MTPFAFLESAGFVGLLLIALGLVACYLVCKHLYTFVRLEISLRQNKGNSPLSPITQALYERSLASLDEKRKEVSHLFYLHFAPLLRELQILRLISVISPLLGLMGTILGIMRIFALMAETPNANPSQFLAGGIWQALITTILGLVVAIPALVAFYLSTLYLKHLRFVVLTSVSSKGDAL